LAAVLSSPVLEGETQNAPRRVAARARFTVLRPRQPWDDFEILSRISGQAQAFLPQSSAPAPGGVILGPALAPIYGHRAVAVEQALPEEHFPLRRLKEEKWSELAQTFYEERDHTVFSRRPSPLSENVLAAGKEALAQRLALVCRIGVLGYSLGEGPGFGRGAAAFDLAPDPEMLEVFRAWLRRKYPSLIQLNEQWGTTYRNWEEVAPPPLDAVKAAQDEGYGAAWAKYLLDLDKFLNPPPQPPEPAKPPEKLATPAVPGPATGPEAAKKEEQPPEKPKFHYRSLERSWKGGENFSAWCDYREFLEFALARLLSEYRDQVREVDPDSRVGITGAPPPAAFTACDYSRLVRVLDWVVTNGESRTPELLRDLNPALPFLSPLGEPDLGARRRLWRNWLAGAAGALLTAPDKVFSAPPVPGAAARLLAADVSELARGVSLQRALMPRRPDSIALYYSPRSLVVHWLLDSLGDGSAWPERSEKRAAAQDSGLRALDSWCVLLHDLGYDPVFVTEEQLLRGGLRAKVLVLPKVLCLSKEEAEAIKQFARLGGVVLADSQCGLFDRCGRRYALPPGGGAAGALDEAFGLRRLDFETHEYNGAFQSARKNDRVRLLDPLTLLPLGPESVELRINEPGVRATGAWQYGRTEQEGAAILSRSGGLGRFIYLNLAMQDYPGLREQHATDFNLAGMEARRYARLFGKPMAGEALRVLVGDMLQEALGEPRLAVRAPDGTPLRGLGRVCWKDGEAFLVAIVPPVLALPAPPAEPQGLTQELCVSGPGRRHWYDVRRGRYLGLDAVCAVTVETDRPALLAALPYRVTGLRGKARRWDARGRFLISLALETAADGCEVKARPGIHVAHVEVFSPEGHRLPHYARNLVLRDGRWEGIFNLGHNEPDGEYLWVAGDTLSGERRTIRLLKSEGAFAELFPPPPASPQHWTPQPDNWSLALNGDRLDLQVRLVLVPRHTQLALPPQVEVVAPKSWKAECRLELDPAALANLDPCLEPLPVNVSLSAPWRSLASAAPESFHLTVKGRTGQESFAMPLRVAGIPPEVSGTGPERWGRAQIGGFILPKDGAPAQAPTAVHLRRNPKALLIRAECVDGQLEALSELKLKARGRDDPALLAGDWLELSVTVPGVDVVPIRVRVDPAGAIWDARGSDDTWDSKLSVKTETTEKGWAVELALPWEELGLMQPPVPGQVLRVGFARRRVVSGEEAEHSAWRLDDRAPSHQAAALGFAVTTP
jgi:hypothetical protein